MRVLLIEDELKVANFVMKGLESEGFVVDVANDGLVGLKMAFDQTYDCIILDLMLPEINGISILSRIREEEIRTPVIIVSSLGNLDDRVKGLNIGADDYLVKPFAFEELLARVKALIRREHGEVNAILLYDPLKINTVSREVSISGELIDLTPKEYSLLEFFAYNANRALNRITLSEHVWDYNFDRGTNLIDVFVNRLRNKIEKGSLKYIHTVRGYGYIFKSSDNEN